MQEALTGDGAADTLSIDEAEVWMAEKIPSKRLIFRAIRNEETGKWQGFFASPGHVPDVYRRVDGTPVEFDDPEEARLAAAEAMVLAFNKPRNITRRRSASFGGRPRRWTGPELCLAMREADIKPGELSEIYGTRLNRVQSWMDGTQDIPHPIRVLMELFMDNPDLVDDALDITEQAAGESS